MKLNYEELKCYYKKGLLQPMLDKLHMAGDDIVEVVINHISDLEEELEGSEIALHDSYELVDNLKDRIDNLTRK